MSNEVSRETPQVPIDVTTIRPAQSRACGPSSSPLSAVHHFGFTVRPSLHVRTFAFVYNAVSGTNLRVGRALASQRQPRHGDNEEQSQEPYSQRRASSHAPPLIGARLERGVNTLERLLNQHHTPPQSPDRTGDEIVGFSIQKKIALKPSILEKLTQGTAARLEAGRMDLHFAQSPGAATSQLSDRRCELRAEHSKVTLFRHGRAGNRQVRDLRRSAVKVRSPDPL